MTLEQVVKMLNVFLDTTYNNAPLKDFTVVLQVNGSENRVCRIGVGGPKGIIVLSADESGQTFKEKA